MTPVLDFLERTTGPIVLTLILAVASLAVIVAVQHVRQKQFRRRWADLTRGSDGASLESLLHDHLTHRIRLEQDLEDAVRRLAALEAKMRSSKRYLGLVRYDAFDDVGGAQSFALALYDEEGNGAVITNQVGRETTRIYGKPLLEGRADRALSTEEQRAVEEAGRGRSRPRITP